MKQLFSLDQFDVICAALKWKGSFGPACFSPVNLCPNQIILLTPCTSLLSQTLVLVTCYLVKACMFILYNDFHQKPSPNGPATRSVFCFFFTSIMPMTSLYQLESGSYLSDIAWNEATLLHFHSINQIFRVMFCFVN